MSSIQPTTTAKKAQLDNKNSQQQFLTQGEYDKLKQKQIQKSVSSRLEYNAKLEQDEMEGVDEGEWEE